MYPIGNFWMKGKVFLRELGATGVEVTSRFDRENALVTHNMRGAYGELATRGQVFRYGASAVTIPVIANNLVSVFGIYNPPDSGVDVEIIDTEITQALATTVVNQYCWAASATAALSAAATFTTLANALSGRVGVGPSNKARVYSAVTHSGTPVKVAPVSQNGAVTANAGGGLKREYNGSLILPPGFLMSVAATVAAGTTSGNNVDLAWAEIPIPA